MTTMHPVDSHNIFEVGHDPESGALLVRFRRKGGPGSLYAYTHKRGQSLAHHVEGIRDAKPSPTAHFNFHIKDHPDLDYRRVEDAPSA